jgi:hypothetical protein
MKNKKLNLFDSCPMEVIPEELDLFGQRAALFSIGDSKYERVNTRTALGGANIAQLEFSVAPDKVNYTDLSESFLMVKCMYTKADGEEVEVDPKIGPVQHPLTSIFSNIDMAINNHKVTPNETHLPWIQWLHLMSLPKQVKKTYLTEGLWYEDSYTSIAACSQSDPQAEGAGSNKGLKKRASFFGASKSVILVGKLYIAPHNTRRLYLPHLKFDYIFEVAPTKFHSMSQEPEGSYLFKIQEAALLIKRVTVSPSVALSHAQILQNSNAVYPIRHMMARSYNIPSGSLDFNFPNAFIGLEMPKALFVILITTLSKQGALTKNPFCCYNLDLQQLTVYLGSKKIPAPDFKINAEEGQSQLALWSTYMALDYWSSKLGPGALNRESMNKGAFIYGFDLTRDGNPHAPYSNSNFEASHLSLTGSFKAALRNSYTRKLKNNLKVAIKKLKFYCFSDSDWSI